MHDVCDWLTQWRMKGACVYMCLAQTESLLKWSVGLCVTVYAARPMYGSSIDPTARTRTNYRNQCLELRPWTETSWTAAKPQWQKKTHDGVWRVRSLRGRRRCTREYEPRECARLRVGVCEASWQDVELDTSQRAKLPSSKRNTAQLNETCSGQRNMHKSARESTEEGCGAELAEGNLGQVQNTHHYFEVNNKSINFPLITHLTVKWLLRAKRDWTHFCLLDANNHRQTLLQFASVPVCVSVWLHVKNAEMWPLIAAVWTLSSRLHWKKWWFNKTEHRWETRSRQRCRTSPAASLSMCFKIKEQFGKIWWNN